MHDRIHFTDVRKELVSESFALACALYKSRNIHKFDGGRCNLLSMIQLAQFHDSLIRYRHNSDIRIDRRERIVCG